MTPQATEAPASTAAPPEQLSVSSQPAAPTPPPPPPPTSPACQTGRHTVDQPDDSELYQLHILYVIPKDGADRHYDTDGSLARSMQGINAWLAVQTGGSALRVDTCGGAPDVTFVRIPQTDAEIRAAHQYVRDRVQDAVRAQGFDAPRKLYLAWYDGSSDWSCGGGAWPPDLPGHVAAMYLRGEPPGAPACDTNLPPGSPGGPHYLDWGIVHEALHTLGLVATCAPHEHHGGHVDEDPSDLMWQGTGNWQPSVLDVGHDDYYAAGITGCPDLARSAFLDPLPADAETPPAW